MEAQNEGQPSSSSSIQCILLLSSRARSNKGKRGRGGRRRPFEHNPGCILHCLCLHTINVEMRTIRNIDASAVVYFVVGISFTVFSVNLCIAFRFHCFLSVSVFFLLPLPVEIDSLPLHGLLFLRFGLSSSSSKLLQSG